jgi:hypothetical protein
MGRANHGPAFATIDQEKFDAFVRWFWKMAEDEALYGEGESNPRGIVRMLRRNPSPAQLARVRKAAWDAMSPDLRNPGFSGEPSRIRQVSRGSGGFPPI